MDIHNDPDVQDGILDCLIIGAGPAGLMAAVYLRRYRRHIRIVDTGRSRAAWIPHTNNFPGIPGGISGRDLLDKMRVQLQTYGQAVEQARATRIEIFSGASSTGERMRGCDGAADVAHADASATYAAHPDADGFIVTLDTAVASVPGDVSFASPQGMASPTLERVRARRVLLATGIDDRLPEVGGIREAVGTAAVRLCPICDGFEIAGMKTAVYGAARRAFGHARFLRTFTQQVVVIADDLETLDAAERDDATALGIALLKGRAEDLRIDETGRVGLRGAGIDGADMHFDTFYPVMGTSDRVGLIDGLDAVCDASGALQTDKHQRTSVPYLFAAGDAVNTLNQIAVATGEAAIAATAIHNSLALNPL